MVPVTYKSSAPCLHCPISQTPCFPSARYVLAPCSLWHIRLMPYKSWFLYSQCPMTSCSFSHSPMNPDVFQMPYKPSAIKLRPLWFQCSINPGAYIPSALNFMSPMFWVSCKSMTIVLSVPYKFCILYPQCCISPSPWNPIGQLSSPYIPSGL